jgi:O-antigen ligase
MILAPAEPWHGWRGVLLIIAGLTISILPPRVKIPRLPVMLAAGFLLLAALVFLPAGWFPVPEWRKLLLEHGLSLSDTVTAHPRQTAECLSGIAVCLIVMLYLQGHRVSHGGNHLLGMVFTAGVAVVALFSMFAQNGRWVIPWDAVDTFGFFPNRNHMATLLVMGAITGAGVAMQSLRVHTRATGLVALVSVIVCIWAAIGYTGSRGGVALLAGVFAAWLLTLGRDYLKGRTLVAAGLLVGGTLLFFFFGESRAKKRLDETADHLSAIATAGSAGESAWKGKAGMDSFESFDMRVPIYLDTVSMLLHEPWTGTGAGQFQYIFPQYRSRSAFVNNRQAVHPESDWLLFAAETGIPATLLLGALAVVTVSFGFRQAMNGRARALRTGCLMAAAVLPVHGLFDVPGHRMELVWAASWLVAISLRGSKTKTPASPFSMWLFRALGLAIVAAGAVLVSAQWFGGPAPAMLISSRAVEKTGELYKQDLAAQEAAGGNSAPATGREDKLEQAIQLLDEALKIVPMDPRLHLLKGALSAEFDDKDAVTDREFELARILDPTWVAMPLMQAAVWAEYDPRRTEALWTQAMKRAEVLEQENPDSLFGRKASFARIMEDAANYRGLGSRAVGAAGNDAALLKDWASEARRGQLDVLIPEILSMETLKGHRREFFEVWRLRGTKPVAEGYARKFDPELLNEVKAAGK